MEALTRLNPKTSSWDAVGGSHGAFTAQDIAASCHVLSNLQYCLLMAYIAGDSKEHTRLFTANFKIINGISEKTGGVFNDVMHMVERMGNRQHWGKAATDSDRTRVLADLAIDCVIKTNICWHCKGTRFIDGKDCQTCKGTGKKQYRRKQFAKMLDIHINTFDNTWRSRLDDLVAMLECEISEGSRKVRINLYG